MNPDAQYGYVQPQKSPNRRKKIIIAAIVVIVVLLGSLLLLNSSTGKGEATSFISLVEKNDATRSYDFFSPSQKELVDLPTWKTKLQQITEKRGQQKFKLDHTSQSETTQNIKYEYYTFSNLNINYTYSLVLTSVQGKWLVESSYLSQDSGYAGSGKATTKE